MPTSRLQYYKWPAWASLLRLICAAVLVTGLSACREEAARPDTVYACDDYTVTSDSVSEPPYYARAVGALRIESNYPGAGGGWTSDNIDGRYPTYNSGQPLADALYNMAVSEVASNLGSDGIFLSGTEIPTPLELSCAVCLSLAPLAPEGAMRSLRACVRDGRIIQPPSFGGGWPVSSDRTAWALASWEVYKVTGDRDWLREAFAVVDRTLKQDIITVWNERYSLMRGRQSLCTPSTAGNYPEWASPVDVYESMCLTANVVASRAFAVASEMAAELGLNAGDYKGRSRTIATAVNDRLWIPNYGFYSQYLYGGIYPLQSFVTDNLGQSLAILYGVASSEMARSIVEKTPCTVYGVPTATPMRDARSPWAGDAVRPVIQGFWNMACARTGNLEALSAGLGALWRGAALFATGKELYASSSGDCSQEPGNNDRRLGSAAAILASHLRIIFGLDFSPAGIEFHPVVLPVFSGTKTLSGLRYRDAILDITVSGTGNYIAGFSVDGVATKDYRIDSSLKGHHTVAITMASNVPAKSTANIVAPVLLPPIPETDWTDYRHVRIRNYNLALNYGVYINGVFREEVGGSAFELPITENYTVTAVTPVSANRWVGYPAPLHEYIPDSAMTEVRAADFATPGTRLIRDKAVASQFVELTRQRNTHLTLYAGVEDAGEYFIRVSYANGSGPVSEGDKCAVRTLFVNGQRAGTVVMPQRGEGDWSSTGYSNTLPAHLKAGLNIIALDYVVPNNENENGKTNTALIDRVVLIRKQ